MVTDIRVQDAYADRAAEYTALFGSTGTAHEQDQRLIARWAQSLLGFFNGPAGESFPHAVTTAYYWSEDAMSQHLAAAGFEVLEVHVRTEPGNRPHAAIIAVRTTPQR
jgi:hypothetical protein